MSFFNYFSDSEKEGADRAKDIKNRMFAWAHPLLVKFRVHPDALSYVGLALLVGVVIWFKAHPLRASLLIVLYVFNDGLDGSYARYLKRPTQAGAFTDIVADQLGMIVIALGFIQYGMVDGQIGAYYIMIYLIMIVFSVIQNAQGIPMQYIFRSKYILYAIYMFWALTRINLAPYLLPIFCLVMTVSVVQSYRRLKRGFYWKYDLPNILAMERRIRARGGTPPKFIPSLKVILPWSLIALLLAIGVYPQLVAMVEKAEHKPNWKRHEIRLHDDDEAPRSVAALEDGWLVSTYNADTHFSRFYYLAGNPPKPRGQFRVPWAMDKDHGSCADGNHLYIADRYSRSVYDVDIGESLNRGVAALDRSFDTTLDAPVGCALIQYRGMKHMLISEYMNRYKTIVVDHEKAFAAGTAEPFMIRWYRNAGFSRGLATEGGLALELNSSLWRDLIYVIDLETALDQRSLRAGIITTIASPGWRCRDLSIHGRTIALVDGKTPNLFISPLPKSYLSPKPE